MVTRTMYTGPPRKRAEVYAPRPGPSSAGDRRERRGREARPTDQKPVRPRRAEERAAVLGGDRATIEEAQIPTVGQDLGDVNQRRSAILGSGRPAGPDGPDRLVGDDERLGRSVGPEGVELPHEGRRGQPGVALLFGFPDAEDRHQPCLTTARDLLREHGPVLAEEPAAFGVADDRVGAPGVRGHGGRDLSRKGAFGFGRDVLAPQPPTAAVVAGRVEERVSRRHDELGPGDAVANR